MPRHYTPGPLPFVPFTQVEMACEECGQRFLFGKKYQRTRRFCSPLCRHRGMRVAVDVRLWARIERRGPDAHWLWTASVDHSGYGQISDGMGRKRKAHQLVLEMKLGRPLLVGEYALHHCDVRACCNPAHLYVGSAKDNTRDMHARGRYQHPSAPGSRNANAKMTEEDAIAILAMLATDPPPGTKIRLAHEHGVTPSTISKLAHGQSWKHLLRPPQQDGGAGSAHPE